jgi:proteasome lid subunit RPN8/RPN11/molybdopterin converting factor small subunit
MSTAPNATVYVPTPWRRLTGGAAHVAVDVAPGETTLAALVDRIDARYPGLKAEIWEGQDFKHYVNVYLNGEEVRALQGAATPVAEGDQVAFVPMLAGGAERFELSQAHRDEMIQHAIEDAPNECCGVVMERPDGERYLRRLINADASPFSYSVRGEDLLDIFLRRVDEGGEKLVSIYHSHTHTAAYPSATDVRMALYPESIYTIVSLQDRANPAVRAFRIVDGEIAELEVVVR